MQPLQDPSYLLSIIQVIADSLHDQSSASIHGLLDAYVTFVNRVRSQSQLLEAGDTSLPALAPLGVHKDNFVRALKRDVRLAHFDPFSTLSHPPASLDETSIHLNIKIDTRRYARDSSSLCHHALCALTTIFRFPVLYIAFPEHDLSSLFSDILDIALADKLPVLNEEKTYSLSLWALGCHRLPVTVLRSRQDDICSALQQSLDGARRPGNIVLDGMKAVSHTIEHYPSPFLGLLFPLLPHVITNLISKSFEHRLHASIALGKFANALIHQTELSLSKWRSLSDHITSFLESFCDESRAASGETSFACMVHAAFSAESHTRHTDGPAWILAVLASLIVLCGPALYVKPTLLRSILQSLALALTHKRQMLFSSDNVEPALISSAFYVIRQEVRGGIGIALASVLLSDRMPATRSDERGDRVSRALLVIKAMVRTECKHTRQEGFMFLQAFTNDAHVRHQILHNVFEIPASVLLDGAIIRADWDGLPPIIHSIPKVPISLHWLDEIEIARHCKTLLAIWKHFASKADGKHSIPIAEMLRYAAAIIVGFLPPEDCQPDWGSWSVHDQLYSLTFIDQLWSAMRRAFAAFDLAEVAELILTSILNLMIVAPPSFLRDTRDPTTSQLVIRSQRELWGIVATSLSSSELSLDWKELVKFLTIPVWYIVILPSRA
ncbi:hypothetical protein JVT61DRAFT_1160 [Boletus reticuloceps]|uniref:Uncharacterized protein n=1 Tax=Boletus reticuloceps TaxID=495285 RepID=A0A8I2YPZ1_9AGAM|nr:hypothetical protein JVT61DRAFT_1160 [Boletus reticuloceps]